MISFRLGQEISTYMAAINKELLENLKKKVKNQCHSQNLIMISTSSTENHIREERIAHTLNPSTSLVIRSAEGDCARLYSSTSTSKQANNLRLLSKSVEPTDSLVISAKSSDPVSLSMGKESGSTSAPSQSLAPKVKWICIQCSNQCLPVIRESRCLCGHRLKEHKQGHTPSKEIRLPCSAKQCKCKCFLYIVAEGSWMLRCRCKHKHSEHDCSAPPFSCVNARCQRDHLCSGFDSPWVCNCGHVWSSHQQRIELAPADAELEDLGDEGHDGERETEKGKGLVSKKQFAVRRDGFSSSEMRDIDLMGKR